MNLNHQVKLRIGLVKSLQVISKVEILHNSKLFFFGSHHISSFLLLTSTCSPQVSGCLLSPLPPLAPLLPGLQHLKIEGGSSRGVGDVSEGGTLEEGGCGTISVGEGGLGALHQLVTLQVPGQAIIFF